MAHLTIQDRETIMVMKLEGHSQRSIAREIGRCESVVCRELQRNGGVQRDAYSANTAQKMAQQRRSIPRTSPKLEDPDTLAKVTAKLKLRWSPQQIGGHFKASPQGHLVSHQTIYNFLDQLPRKHPLRQCLRRRGRKNRKQKPGFIRRAQRGRRSIHERPQLVAKRSRLGDWELDLMCCAGRSGFLLTAVDRKSDYCLIRKVRSRHNRVVMGGIVKMFEKIPRSKRKTFTFDNGTEFYHFSRLERELGVKVYYADPYNSGQRGTNENTNGLIRDDFAKDLAYGLISPRDVRQAERWLNERPRLRHGFQTPTKVFG